MTEHTLGDILKTATNGRGPDFEEDNTNPELLGRLNALDAPLPPQVEKTCEIFEKRFVMTADRLDLVADKLELMASDLRVKAGNVRAAAETLPNHIRSWVLTERSYIADAQFFDPIVK
jgi:hypothetical protein